MIMEGLAARACPVRFHVACFHVWDVERQIWERQIWTRAEVPVSYRG